MKLSAATLALVVLLASSPAVGAAEEPDPEAWTIPPFRIGDVARYTPTQGVIELRITGHALHRDGYGVLRDVAVGIEEWLTFAINPQIVHIDVSTGTMTSYNHLGAHGGLDRLSFTSFGSPYLFGASVLAGRTIRPGDIYGFPLYDGMALQSVELSVLPPVSEGGAFLLPVHVTISSGQGRVLVGGPFAVTHDSTFYLDATSPFPAKLVLSSGEVEWRRVAYEPGGEVAWTATETASAPWTTRPGFTVAVQATSPPGS